MGRHDGMRRKSQLQNAHKKRRRLVQGIPVCKRVNELISMAKSYPKVSNDEIEAAVGRVAYFRILRSQSSQTSSEMLSDMYAALLGNGYISALECLAPKIVTDQKLHVHDATRVLTAMPHLSGLDPCVGARVVNLLVPVTNFASDVAARYWASRARWAVLEFLEETQGLVRRTRTSSLAECVRRGTAVGGLVFSRISGKRKNILVLERQRDDGRVPPIPHHVLSNGDSAVLSLTSHGATTSLPSACAHAQSTGETTMQVPHMAFEVDVVSVWGSTVEVAPRFNGDVRVLQQAEEHVGAVWRIDKGSNMRQYQRIIRALGDLVSGVGSNGVCDTLVQSLDTASAPADRSSPKASESDASGSTAVAVLSSADAAGVATPMRCFSPERIARLNASQRRAWTAATARKTPTSMHPQAGSCTTGNRSNAVTLIQGPPGTGKTTVALCILQQWVHDARWPDVAPLGTPSGNFSEPPRTPQGKTPAPSARDSGGEPFANPWRHYHGHQPCPYPCCTPRGKDTPRDTWHPLGDTHPRAVLCCADSNTAVDNLLEGLLRRGVRAIRVGRSESIRSKLWAYTLDETMNTCRRMEGAHEATHQRNNLAHMLYHAQVVCATCIGAGSPVFTQNNVAMSFHRVLIDEATQATEIASIVPLLRRCQELVLVGDHAQLPPTILSADAASEGCEVSLFERLANNHAVDRPTLLQQQYRMHPGIAQFPSDCFYGGRVHDGVSRSERPLPRGYTWPNPDIPVAFMDCADGHEFRAEGQSLYNDREIEAVVTTVSQLLKGGCLPQDVGVVTPYSAQVTRLRRRLAVFDGRRADGHFVECSSVDAFQGREKDVIVISTVRANRDGQVGFLSDWRRTNVAITRARRGLVVIGHRQTLAHESLSWAPWLRWAGVRGIMQDHVLPSAVLPSYNPSALRVHGATLTRTLRHPLWWEARDADGTLRLHRARHVLHDRVCDVGSLSDMDFQNRDAFLGGGLAGGGTRSDARTEENDESPTLMILTVSTPGDIVTLSPPLRVGTVVQLVRRTVSGWLQVTPTAHTAYTSGALRDGATPPRHTRSSGYCAGTHAWLLPTSIQIPTTTTTAPNKAPPTMGLRMDPLSGGVCVESMQGLRHQHNDGIHALEEIRAPSPPNAPSSPGTPPMSPGTPPGSPGTPPESPGTPPESPGTPTHSPGTPTHSPGTPMESPRCPTDPHRTLLGSRFLQSHGGAAANTRALGNAQQPGHTLMGPSTATLVFKPNGTEFPFAQHFAGAFGPFDVRAPSYIARHTRPSSP